jgi:serine/threonine-protein kinase RsbW
MAAQTVIQEKLATGLGAISDFLARAEGALKPLKFSKEESFKIKLALEEALTNAMRHGNKLKPELFVDVAVFVEPSGLVLEVKDQGLGFAAEHLPDPTTKENKDRPHGRGVYLMKSLMDEVTFQEGGSKVRMVKYLR